MIFSRSVASEKEKGSVVKTFGFLSPTFTNHQYNNFPRVVIQTEHQQRETETICKSLYSPFTELLLHSLTNLVMDGPFSQQLRVVDSLSSRKDLLPPHEHVIGVGAFLVESKKK